ncbi:Delta2-dienoyl-CoA-isomerase [Flagelloscypha sp. PMI_526]|nr:Delta2-dienoyl-CoA-isomerase [Flagelloscypha sp. PMI_526]
MSFSTDYIQVSEPYPGVAHVEMNSGELLALFKSFVLKYTLRFWTEFGLVFTKLAQEGGHIRVAVLSSKLPKFFTAGLDLTDFGGSPPPGSEADTARQGMAIRNYLHDFQAAIGATEKCHFPVICALHGHVIGLGCDMMGSCDVRYAASNTSFTIKEVDVGLAADIGSLAYLPKIGGNQSLLRELAYTGRKFTPAEALAVGFVSKVVEGGRDEVITAALETAKTIASKSPVAISGTKRVLIHSRDHTVADNLEYVATWNASALQTEDIMSSVNPGGKPVFKPLRVGTKL